MKKKTEGNVKENNHVKEQNLTRGYVSGFTIG